MRILARCAAAAGALALVAGGVGVAGADEAQNVVSFGDSYFANPTTEDFAGAKAAAIIEQVSPALAELPAVQDQLAQYEAPGGCGHGDNNIPAQIAEKLGMENRDYSCAGAVAYLPLSNTLAAEVDRAVEDGALDGNTALVPIQIGFNDTYQTVGVPTELKSAAYAQALDSAIAKIRAAAPQARIMILNYPTISDPDTSMQCLVHVDYLGQDIDGGVPAPWILWGEEDTSQFAQDAATRNGAEFVNVRELTTDRNECTSDENRIVAGVIDNRSGEYNLPVHLNATGVNLLSDIVVEQYL